MAAKVSRKNRMYSKADFVSAQMVRWCPGCGDYAVLSAMQRALSKMNIAKEKHVFVSGIGCASRFPYYMNSYGFHTIHGRASTVASGVALANPELTVWVIMGDGDSLSIGLGHTMHLLRRNINVNVVILNNQIYGLTKGQHSPTSPYAKVTRSSPFGNPGRPIDPLSLAYSLDAGFIARSHDKNIQGMEELFLKAAAYKGTAFIEIYQNCNIFNDAAFDSFTGKKTREEHSVMLEDGKALIFGAKDSLKAVFFNTETFELSSMPYIREDFDELGHQKDIASSLQRILVHKTKPKLSGRVVGSLYAEMTHRTNLPTPFGLFREELRPLFEEHSEHSKAAVKTWQSPSREKNLQKLLRGNSTWHA